MFAHFIMYFSEKGVMGVPNQIHRTQHPALLGNRNVQKKMVQ